MKPDDVARLYDDAYAASYDDKFLHAAPIGKDTQFELKLLASLMGPRTRWLDVACGTGFFLRSFPGIDRTGLDLSPAMIAQARRDNDGATILQGDYRQDRPEWNGRFGLVSCMWYAYGYVESVTELLQVIANLSAWTAPDGACFVPLADPNLILRRRIPDWLPYAADSHIAITGILWSFLDEKGAKNHRHLLSPGIAFMKAAFERHFEEVRIVRYPRVNWRTGRRPALIATLKRAAPLPEDAQPMA